MTVINKKHLNSSLDKRVILGCWKQLHKREDVKAFLEAAYKQGIREWDTGENYLLLGRFHEHLTILDTTIPRKQIKIYFKVGNKINPEGFIKFDNVHWTNCINNICGIGNTQYIDTLMLWGIPEPVTIKKLAEWLIKMMNSGKITGVGLSNISACQALLFESQLRQIIGSCFSLDCIQIKTNVCIPGYTELLESYRKISRNINLICYSIFNSGLLFKESSSKKLPFYEQEFKKNAGQKISVNELGYEYIFKNYLFPLFHSGAKKLIIGMSSIRHLNLLRKKCDIL